jgi:DNA-directed RNA polymerase specialized sigma24 family protein
MDDDSRDPPDPQVFWLHNGCLVLFPCEPEAPARDPPRASGADQAARALVAHTPLVRGELRRWGVPERDVPDLVQNVLLDVLPWWTHHWLAPAARVEAELVTYIRVVARRAAMRHGRRRSKRRERLECEMELLFALDEPDPAPSPEEAIMVAQAKRALWDLLSPESLSQLLGRPLWHIHGIRSVAASGEVDRRGQWSPRDDHLQPRSPRARLAARRSPEAPRGASISMSPTEAC